MSNSYDFPFKSPSPGFTPHREKKSREAAFREEDYADLYESHEVIDDEPGDPIPLPPREPQRARLNFFQQDFQKPPQPDQVEANQQFKRNAAVSEYQKSKAFNNFKKSTETLVSNAHQGVQVKLIADSTAKFGPKKSVQFDESKNSVHFIEKYESEYLTQEEKLNLTQRIRMHAEGLRPRDSDEDDTYDDEESFVDPEQQDIQVSQPKELRAQPVKKGILKKSSERSYLPKPPSHHPAPPPQTKPKQSQNLKKKQLQDFQHYGIGHKLLVNVGYTGGGLGANEQGITKPVEAVHKTAFVGMGNLTVDPEDSGEEVETNDGKLDDPADIIGRFSKQQKKKEKLWKKSQQSTSTARAEILQNLDRNSILKNLLEGKSAIQDLNTKSKQMEEPPQERMTIIDMTGSEPKDYFGKPEPNVKEVRDYLNNIQNLQWSIQSLLDKKRSKLEFFEQSIKKEKDKTILIEHEKIEEEQHIERLDQSISRKQKFVDYLTTYSKDGVINFDECFKKHKDEFVEFNIQGYLIQQLELKISSIQWTGPTCKSDEALLVQVHGQLKDCLNLIKEALIHKMQSRLSKYAEQIEQSDCIIMDKFVSTADVRLLRRYAGYLIKSILTRLRTYIINFWNPTQPNNLLEFLNLWTKECIFITNEEKQVVKMAIIEEQIKDIEYIIYPKLEQAIQDWSFSREMPAEQYLHVWLVPWIQSKYNSQDLLKSVVAKLNQIQWKAEEQFGFQLLSPWQNCLGDKWMVLLHRNIVPKLLFLVQNIEINPAAQDITGIKAVMLWSEHIDQHLVMVFEGLMTKIQRTLEKWMMQEGSSEEMRKWLEGWENFLYKKIVSRVYKFQAEFNLMKAKLQAYQTSS